MTVDPPLAARLLPILHQHAATQLLQVGINALTVLAYKLQAGHGSAILLTSAQHANSFSFPKSLREFGRVLHAFTEATRETTQGSPHRANQPEPWMLHSAATAIRDQAGRGNSDARAMLADADTMDDACDTFDQTEPLRRCA